MRVLPPALAQKLKDGVTTLAVAWRLTRQDGVQVAVTQHDRDLTFDGTLFVSALSFVGSEQERQVNLAPDRCALSGALTIDSITETDLALGRWDQTKVEAFWVDWANPRDFIPMWSGQVAGASWRGAAFELDIVGPETALNHQIGRVYARTCDAALGDSRCKVNLATNGRMANASIASAISDRRFTITAPAGKTAGEFVGGALKFVTGPIAGWEGDISHIEVMPSVWLLSVSRPFPIAPVAGDGVKIGMGCDKSYATCQDRFDNGLNFRGQPTLPGDDVAFGGPAISGNDGAKR